MSKLDQKMMDLPPIRQGLFETNPPRLLASRCLKCGELSFPAKSACPFCNHDEVEADVSLSTSGKIYSYTVVRQAPGGRSIPYVLAYVDLPESVRLLSRIDCPPESVTLDMPVELEILPVEDMNGERSKIGYVFRRTEDTGE